MLKNILICILTIVGTSSLSAEKKVLAFSGSTRTNSYNQQLVTQAAEIARQYGASVTVINLKDYSMPFYNADQESTLGMPFAAKQFRRLMLTHDAIIIATPEYNASMPGELKNAIDWATRSVEGTFSVEPFQKKKFALMSASPGKGGGKRALEELTRVIRALGGKVVSERVSVAEAHNYFGRGKPPHNSDLAFEVKELLSD